MPTRNWRVWLIPLLALGLTGCAAIEGIFKAGVGVGAAAVIVVIVLIAIVWALIRGGSRA